MQQGEINRTTPVPGIDGSTIDEELYYCHVPGNLSNNSPKVPVDRGCNCEADDRGCGVRPGTGMCHIYVILAQHDYGIIPSTWLLIDTCSTSSVGKNLYIFRNIWRCLE